MKRMSLIELISFVTGSKMFRLICLKLSSALCFYHSLMPNNDDVSRLELKFKDTFLLNLLLVWDHEFLNKAILIILIQIFKKPN